jgi:hypothetical protein
MLLNHTGRCGHVNHQAVLREGEKVEILLPEELINSVDFGNRRHVLLGCFICVLRWSISRCSEELFLIGVIFKEGLLATRMY